MDQYIYIHIYICIYIYTYMRYHFQGGEHPQASDVWGGKGFCPMVANWCHFRDEFHGARIMILREC